MKKHLVIAIVAISFAFAPLQNAVAQYTTSNIFSISILGPSTQIIVLNNTTDNSPILATIGNRVSPTILDQGKRWGRSFGAFNGGQIPILMQVCKETEDVFHFNNPPEWTQDERLGTLALTVEYLAHINEPALKQRVEDLKRFIRNDLRAKAEKHELDDWFKMVKNEGISVKGKNCELPYTLAAVTFDWGQWNSYGQLQTTMLIVTGSKKDGYHVERPPYIYPY
jgi:hypothetical protein